MVNRYIGWFFGLIRVLVDALLIVVAFNAAWWLRYVGGIGGSVGVQNFVPLASYAGMRAGLIWVMLLVFLVSGIYRTSTSNRLTHDASKLIRSILSSLGLLVVALFVLRIPFASPLLLAYSGIVATIFLLGPRLIAQGIKCLPWRCGIGVIRVLVIGDGMAAQDVLRELLQHPSGSRQCTQPELVQLVVRTCLRRHVDVRPVLTIHNHSLRSRAWLAKRAFDIVFSLVVLFPFGLLIMALAVIAIKLDSPDPALFRQKRVAIDGSVFWVYKFRSMHVNAEVQRSISHTYEKDGPIFKMRHDPRVTRVGKWLRRTSLDELPQIFNILKGEMSWVGPRPPLISEVEAYQEWHKRRLSIVPGLTGLWQVSGRSLLSFDEMVRLDLYYVENWSIWLDFKILMKTIPSVLIAKGAF